MSGIVGLWNHGASEVDLHDSARSMLLQIAHRGPDGQQIELFRDVSFGHAHLFSTAHSENEIQPLSDSDSGCVITADARLDDRDTLIRRLNIKISNPSSIGDGQLILHSYLKWKHDCPKYLKGDFAFAIWDPQSQTLFAARDHFGVKPFAYFSNSQLFVFASQPKGVLGCSRVPRIINEIRVGDYLVPSLEGIDHVSTFYDQISRLPPAHSILVSGRKTTISCYWKLEAPPELHLSSDTEYEEAFREVFKQAVKRRLQGGNKVGAMLSGGLDSSAITAIGRQICKESGSAPLKTFSGIDPSLTGIDSIESSCIQSVSDQGDIDAHTISPLEYASSILSLEESSGVSDNPFEYSFHLHSAIYRLASEQGVKSLLSGIDGDLTTSLTSRFILYLIRDWQFTDAVKESFYMGYFDNDYHFSISTFMTCLLPAVLPTCLWLPIRQKKIAQKQKYYAANSNISPEFAKQIDLNKRLASMYDLNSPEIESPTAMDRQAYILTSPFVAAALERYDSVAGQHGVECSHPFFDLDLINFCLSLPWNQKHLRGWPKLILRRSIGNLLPPEITWRTDRNNICWAFNQAAFNKRSTLLSPSIVSKLKASLNKYIKPSKQSLTLDEQSLFLASWIQQQAQRKT